MNIAIIQLASWGDVVISTCIPRAIREHRPKAKIVFYTSSVCAGAVENNPDIDEIIIKKVSNRQEAFDVWGHVTKDAKDNHHSKIIVPWAGVLPQAQWRLQKNHHGKHNFMWAYPRAIQELGLPFDGNVKTYLYPTQSEENKVKDFVQDLKKDSDTRFIMMEIAGHSCQTWWNDEWTKKAVETICNKIKKFHLFISHGGPEPQVITDLRHKHGHADRLFHYMNHFSLREMSVLFNSCDTMFSVSSGTANACLTHKCKRNIKWFELVNNTCWDSFPMGNNQGRYIYHQNKPDIYFKIVAQKL